MRAWRRWTLGPAMAASAVWSATLTAQAPPGADDVCSLATNEEFQQAYGVDSRIGIIPDEPTPTQMAWGPHCDYSPGSITLFDKQSPTADLDRVLTISKAGKQRAPVEGLGQRAFFTVIYPDDQYRRAGLLAVFVGPRVLALTMDAHQDKPADATRPGLESLAKLVVSRLE